MRGSIQKRVGTRGTTWYAVVDLPPDPVTGKRRQKRLSAPTRREVEALIAETMQTAKNGVPADAGKLTVREYMDQWLKSAEPGLKPSTFRRYHDLTRRHVIPVLGNIKLAKLSPLDIQRWHADRLATGLSATSVVHLHYMFHRALEQAMRWNMVPRNVTELVDPPRRSTPDAATWNATQVGAFLTAGDKTNLAALWRLALLTGMRRGELLGLIWEDVDLERGTLAVRRTLSRGKAGSWEVGTPKTASGRRSIALPASAVSSLRQHRIHQLEHRLKLGDIYQDQGFVFTNATGGPLHVNSLMLQFVKVIAAAGVPRIRFHDLRHTSATLMLANGEHPKIVQERLGHANISMTLDRYSHVTMDMQRAAADRLDILLSTVL